MTRVHPYKPFQKLQLRDVKNDGSRRRRRHQEQHAKLIDPKSLPGARLRRMRNAPLHVPPLGRWGTEATLDKNASFGKALKMSEGLEVCRL